MEGPKLSRGVRKLLATWGLWLGLGRHKDTSKYPQGWRCMVLRPCPCENSCMARCLVHALWDSLRSGGCSLTVECLALEHPSLWDFRGAQPHYTALCSSSLFIFRWVWSPKHLLWCAADKYGTRVDEGLLCCRPTALELRTAKGGK